MAGIKGMKHRRRRSSKASDNAVLSRIENRLVYHGLGEAQMTPTEVMAARAVYDKLRPSLSAIEQTVVDPRDKQDPAQLAQKLAAIFAEKPELWEQVAAIRAQSAPVTAEQPGATIQ